MYVDILQYGQLYDLYSQHHFDAIVLSEKMHKWDNSII